MRIGLLGGSFNPPHYGHIHISLETAKRLKFNQIWWLPTKQNPLKQSSPDNFQNRLKLCQNITKNHSKILIKDLEKQLPSLYSIDLIKRIIKQYPQYQFFWIMGADNILQFHLWQDWQKIIGLVPLAICDRGNIFYQATKSRGFIYAKKRQKISFLKIKKSPISSTAIRQNNNEL